jgi:hypothetical protein
MRRRVWLVLMGAGLLALPAFPGAGELSAKRAFEALTRLRGDWAATLENGRILRVSYRLIASDSVLAETYTTPSGKETMSMYHLDGDDLMATHYCALGNQPRLVMIPAESTADAVVFAYRDATNLKSAETARMVRLVLKIDDPDAFQYISTYKEKSEESTDTLKFKRVKP